jgi:hypothetical protein
MKKIGTTPTGTVIVEMTVAQFDAISALQLPSSPQPTSGAMWACFEKTDSQQERISCC